MMIFLLFLKGEKMNDFEKRKCHELVVKMHRKELTKPFREKVDPERDGAPDYYEIIKQPMDLATVKKKLAAGEYKTMDLFTTDVNLIWKNAKLYNEEGTYLHLIAQELENWFNNKISKLPRNKEEEWMLQLLKSSQVMSILAHHVPSSIVPMSEHPLLPEPVVEPKKEEPPKPAEEPVVEQKEVKAEEPPPQVEEQPPQEPPKEEVKPPEEPAPAQEPPAQ